VVAGAIAQCYNHCMNKPASFVKELKLVRIGNSTGVVLPKELLARLDVTAGDTLAYSETPTGLALSTRDAQFDEQMAQAREIMKSYRNALRELAK
jgi:putative addiction module antidote